MTKPANHSFKMSDEVLEVYIKGYIEAQLGMKASFAWQGGEPTLAGLPFLKHCAPAVRTMAELY